MDFVDGRVSHLAGIYYDSIIRSGVRTGARVRTSGKIWDVSQRLKLFQGYTRVTHTRVTLHLICSEQI